jgi:hypothetical protein
VRGDTIGGRIPRGYASFADQLRGALLNITLLAKNDAF